MTSAGGTRDPGRLVFIGGLHRSGTTALARTLAKHSAVSGLVGTGAQEDEGQHLQAVYPPARVYGGPGRFALDGRAHLTEHSRLVTAANADALWDAWSPYWDLSRRFVVEKSPPNLVMGRFLQALFPGSALVVVMRNPVVVALATLKWRRLWSRRPHAHASLAQLVEHWLSAHELLLADAPHLQRLHVIRYEQLVRPGTDELVALQHFLGLDTPLSPEGLNARASRGYEQAWDGLGRTGLLQRRRRNNIEQRFTARIEAFGYRLDDLQAVGSLPAALRQ